MNKHSVTLVNQNKTSPVPEQILFKSLSDIINHINNSMKNLIIIQHQMEEKLDSRYDKFQNYLERNDTDKKVFKSEIHLIQQELENMQKELCEINSYINEQKIKIGIFKKIGKFLTSSSGIITMIVSAVASIIMFVLKYIQP